METRLVRRWYLQRPLVGIASEATSAASSYATASQRPPGGAEKASLASVLLALMLLAGASACAAVSTCGADLSAPPPARPAGASAWRRPRGLALVAERSDRTERTKGSPDTPWGWHTYVGDGLRGQ